MHGQRQNVTKPAPTPMQKRALYAAETLLDVSGRHLTSQIPGLAHILCAFAENEIRLAGKDDTE